MPFFDITHPDTGEIITVENDSPPTQEQALATLATVPVTPERQFAAQYRHQQQAGPVEKIATQGGSIVKGLYELISGAVQGAGRIGAEALTPSPDEGISQAVREAVIKTIGGPVMGVPGLAEVIARATPNLAQTEYEGATRLASDIGSMLPTSLPEVARMAAMTYPGVAQASALQSLISRTPTYPETQEAFLAQQDQLAKESGTNVPIAPEVFGKANVPLAKLGPLLPAALPVAEGVNLARQVPNLAREAGSIAVAPLKSLGDIITSSVKSTGKILSKTPREDLLASALNISDNDLKRLGTLESGGYTELVPIIQEKFVPNSGAKGAVKVIGDTVGEQLDRINPVIADAPAEFLNPQNIKDQFRSRLKDMNFTSSQVKELMNQFDERINETSTRNLVGFTKRLGEEANPFFQGNKREGLNTVTVQGAAELRDIYSGIIKDILEYKGIPSESYSVTGRLMDMQNLINKNYLQSFGGTSAEKGRLLREKIIPSGSIPISTSGVAKKVGKGYISKLLVNDLKVLDKKVNNVFEKGNRPLSSRQVEPLSLESFTPEPPLVQP